MLRRLRRPAARQRRGVAATEAALMLPVLVIVVLGSIELANGIYLKQTLSVAAYEGARAACRPNGSVQHGEMRIAEVLTSRSVSNYAVRVSPEVSSSTPRGTEVTVEVTAPAGTFGLGSMPFFRGRTMSAAVRMVRQ